MITLHHLDHSRSHRVLWMLEELGVPYEIVTYQRDPRTMLAPASLKSVHPLGKSPVITEGSTTVAESGAILEYLIERHGSGGFAPAPGTPEHLRYRYFMHYVEGSLMPILLVKLITAKIASAPVPFFVRPIVKKVSASLDQSFVQPNLDRHLPFLEAECGKHPWICGAELTAADIQLSYPLEVAVARAGSAAATPNIQRLLTAMRARPAYQRALERGGPIVL